VSSIKVENPFAGIAKGFENVGKIASDYDKTTREKAQHEAALAQAAASLEATKEQTRSTRNENDANEMPYNIGDRAFGAEKIAEPYKNAFMPAPPISIMDKRLEGLTLEQANAAVTAANRPKPNTDGNSNVATKPTNAAKTAQPAQPNAQNTATIGGVPRPRTLNILSAFNDKEEIDYNQTFDDYLLKRFQSKPPTVLQASKFLQLNQGAANIAMTKAQTQIAQAKNTREQGEYPLNLSNKLAHTNLLTAQAEALRKKEPTDPFEKSYRELVDPQNEIWKKNPRLLAASAIKAAAFPTYEGKYYSVLGDIQDSEIAETTLGVRNKTPSVADIAAIAGTETVISLLDNMMSNYEKSFVGGLDSLVNDIPSALSIDDDPRYSAFEQNRLSLKTMESFSSGGKNLTQHETKMIKEMLPSVWKGEVDFLARAAGTYDRYAEIIENKIKANEYAGKDLSKAYAVVNLSRQRAAQVRKYLYSKNKDIGDITFSRREARSAKDGDPYAKTNAPSPTNGVRLFDINGNPIDLKTGQPIKAAPTQPSAQDTNATKPTPKELRATLGV
ncbi:MAG: hypothetical protein LBQ52_01290, partial [Helicobacteraceae bacterium]|nr:hypothetical protein [Helicobacteraceae bacterium]